MRISVQKILGVGSIPNDRTAAKLWLADRSIATFISRDDGRKPVSLLVSDLPGPERIAVLKREITSLGLPQGQYDDVAHVAYISAPSSIRAEAETRAAYVRVLHKLGVSVGWSDRMAILRKECGSKVPSKVTLKRYLRAVKGVDPINFAPALMPDYKTGGGPRVDLSDDGFSLFLTIIDKAAPTFPLKQAWRDVRDIAAINGWVWPSYSTVYRRWKALPLAQQLVARNGKAETVKRLTQPALRDKTTVRVLECVSLDGRTQDYWTDMGDGKPVRLTMIALIDVASNVILGYELAPSENAVTTARVIRRVCSKFGIFDRLYTDNGSAFAGHLIAGGAEHKFRNAATNKGMRPLGICHHLGIDLTFAMPGNAQAKIAERVFATLSRCLDDRPEFQLAHTGHKPGAAPHAGVVPVPFETVERVVAREIDRYNRETGRRSEGANGRSYQAVFDAGFADRAPRRMTTRQIYLASLIYKPVAVNRDGRVMARGWVYGDYQTQADLLPYHGKGQRVLLGRDPDDLAAPAIAFDDKGDLICEGIAPVKRGAYMSVDGIRDAARNRKWATRATADAAAANEYVSDAEFKTAIAALDMPTEAREPTQPAKVVAARFGAPLRDTKVSKPDAIPEEFYKNMDAALRAKRAQGD